METDLCALTFPLNRKRYQENKEKDMDKEELKKKFIVGPDVLKDRLEPLVTKAMKHCVVAQDGTVHISSRALSAKNQLKLVLSARSLAGQLSDDILDNVGVAELVKSTGLPDNQVRARANELVKEKFATSSKNGFYSANPHKIEVFLDGLSKGGST
jgi:hypothetical protein